LALGALYGSEAVVSSDSAVGQGADLVILPLGDSITWGFKSTSGNGYRQDLLNQLAGNNVLYIGSNRGGNMTNNANEGWPGYLIDQISSKAELSLPQRPNVILLMAGTNDMLQNNSLTTAPARLGSLIDECTLACPDAVVIVAQLTPLNNVLVNPAGESNVLAFNAALPAVIEERVNAIHSKLILVDMQNPLNGLNSSNLNDGIHPNDVGYAKMASIWLDGLRNASSMGWIVPPTKLPSNGTAGVGASPLSTSSFNTIGSSTSIAAVMPSTTSVSAGVGSSPTNTASPSTILSSSSAAAATASTTSVSSAEAAPAKTSKASSTSPMLWAQCLLLAVCLKWIYS